nr:MAG TPA: hypothetical protein [Inoviridae sp.]
MTRGDNKGTYPHTPPSLVCKCKSRSPMQPCAYPCCNACVQSGITPADFPPGESAGALSRTVHSISTGYA